MPLEILPDYFDDATHHGLDRAVDNTVEDDLGDTLNLASNRDYKSLLQAIIANSDGYMDTKYLVNVNQQNMLIKTNGELREMLASAWKAKSYRKIRNLAILIPKPPEEAPTIMADIDLYRKLSGSFEAKYRGAAVDGFYEYLTHNEKLFKTAPPYYAKFCSIVQSSGTGKSRMLTELSKKNVIVIYMNLREENDKLGFPARDPVPSGILTDFPVDQRLYRASCYAFFAALFETLEEYLTKFYAIGNAKADIIHWVRQMCDVSDPPKSTARADFFDRVFRRYTQVHADLVHSLGNRTPGAITMASPITDAHETVVEDTDTDIDKTAAKLGNLSLSADSKAGSPDPPSFARVLLTAYENMAARLERIFSNNSDEPKLVIAIDEAHPLTSVRQAKKPSYRPADVLCRVVNEYTHHKNHAIWVVFASTTSKVADFSPPNQKHNSDRVAIKGEKLFPPYTQLGWDQTALGLGDVDIEGVSQLDHIAGYGRPLWHSLMPALEFTSKVLDTASSKLCGGYAFDPRKINHVLAVLGQRFGLNVTLGHPDSIEQLESGVASHLRICLATTLDRNWRFTNYPSEPLLSCVAANELHRVPGHLDLASSTLLGIVNSGMVDMGQRGELASRLVWLVAKDLFIRRQTNLKDAVVTKTETGEEHLIDCQMISVVDWLGFVFGPQIWNDEDTQASLARKMFENAYLNFSHWICMDANIAGSKEGTELPLDEWTERHWQRTSAVQCSHQQPLVDKVIPIYFRDGCDNTSAKSRMSQIFISDKARKSTDSRNALHSITRRHKSLGGDSMSSESDPNPLPYIAILADLGQSPSFSVTFPEREVDDRCLRIYAAGVSTDTYPFLAKHTVLTATLQNLVRLQQIPETDTPFTEYLNAQMKFGSTATPTHMLWEHGKLVPDMRQKPTGES